MNSFYSALSALILAITAYIGTMTQYNQFTLDRNQDIYTPDKTYFMFIPFITFVILSIIIIRLGFKWPLFYYCYDIIKYKKDKSIKDASTQRECYNPIFYNIIYLVSILSFSITLTLSTYSLVFALYNWNLVLMKFFGFY